MKCTFPWYCLLIVIAFFIITGCHNKTPVTIAAEKNLTYQPEMIIPADEMEEPLDVAALLHDIKEQVSTLESGVRGEDPVFTELLEPVKQSLKDLDTTINGLDPVLKDIKFKLKDLQEQIDRIHDQFEE